MSYTEGYVKKVLGLKAHLANFDMTMENTFILKDPVATTSK